MEKISIVIPVYNSEASLKVLNSEIDSHFEKSSFTVEKIFVDDHSSDSSQRLLWELHDNRDSRHGMKIITLKRNVGQQNALFCGMKYATGEFIVTMDDDLQHDVKYIDIMIEKLKSGADLVYGIHAKDSSCIRSFGSILTGYFFKSTFTVLKGKQVSSFRAFKSKEISGLLSCNYSFIYLSALLLKQVKDVENVEIIKRSRPYGSSGYNYMKLIKLFLKLTYYYGNLVPEFLKPKGVAYEEDYDTRSWQLSAKCH